MKFIKLDTYFSKDRDLIFNETININTNEIVAMTRGDVFTIINLIGKRLYSIIVKETTEEIMKLIEDKESE